MKLYYIENENISKAQIGNAHKMIHRKYSMEDRFNYDIMEGDPNGRQL
jgi:hypothetical protein